MRLGVHLDYRFWRAEGGIWTERAFIVFLGGLADALGGLVVTGRLDPSPTRSELAHYRLPDNVEFEPLPFYGSLASPRGVLAAAWGSVRSFWRLLARVDTVWLLGPHPMGLLFMMLALLRGRRVVLGVRQDLPVFLRAKHPSRRLIHLAADTLEGAYRLAARVFPTVVVGPQLAQNYRHAPRLLETSVSLVREREIPATPPPHPWPAEAPPVALSVGRLEAEKNPVMLADVMAAGRTDWRLAVCGEGPLDHELRERAEALGVAQRIDLLGYVPLDGGLDDLYRSSDALLHVSHTEGVPQILFEAFAAGLPVVATDVGGVAASVGDAALLIPPGDPEKAAAALDRLAGDPALRETLARAGLERLRDSTMEAECARLAEFLRSAGRRAGV